MSPETRGMLLGLIGVAMFSLTLPFTRMAVAEIDPVLVACGRAVIAAIAGGVFLWWRRAPWPDRLQARSLVVVVLGVVVGFPVFTSMAMQTAPAAHGAVVLGILPLATALFATFRCGERPSRGFWAAACVGSAIVVGFALWEGGGSVRAADLALLLGVLAGAMGYAEGGRLSRALGGPEVICWAVVLSVPVMLPICVWIAVEHGINASPRAWLGFAYISVCSMLIGFFFWYKGLALGGIARVGQVQLLQPFMTLAGAALLLGEALDPRHLLFASAVIAIVAIGRRARVAR